jgi:hypothetical protein
MEAGVTQDNHPPVNVSNEPLKGGICDIRGGTRPPHDQPPLIEQETEFAPDNPAMIREAFATNLLRAAPFPHRVDELDPIGVDDAEHGGSGQEDLRPVVMGPQEAQEEGALGEAGKQRPIFMRQPAIEGTVTHALEGMQQPQRDDLTGPEVGLGVCGEACQMVINLTEEGRDKLDGGGHRLLRSWQGGTLSTSVEEVYGQDSKTDKYY